MGNDPARGAIDWDDAYANSAYVPDADQIMAAWPGRAQTFRNTAEARLDVPYGLRLRERYDLFLPEAGPPGGLFIFLHGGYWMAYDKSAWSHLAAGAVARGWTVAMPSYDLCPDVKIQDMTSQICRFVCAAAQDISGPIVVSGHSAGGHLAARLLCRDLEDRGLLPAPAAKRLRAALSISGLHDLAPLIHTEMNATLQLTEKTAAAESPARLTPRPGTRLIALAGADERPEFLRQARLIEEQWDGSQADVDTRIIPGRHHFDVIEILTDPAHEIWDSLLRA